jgi:hypothetical protein
MDHEMVLDTFSFPKRSPITTFRTFLSAGSDPSRGREQLTAASRILERALVTCLGKPPKGSAPLVTLVKRKNHNSAFVASWRIR